MQTPDTQSAAVRDQTAGLPVTTAPTGHCCSDAVLSQAGVCSLLASFAKDRLIIHQLYFYLRTFEIVILTA